MRSEDWARFATVVLEGAYEATLAAAVVLAKQRNERVTVYLTQLGGGAFGNRDHWISHAVERALAIFKDSPLDVVMVHYGRVARHSAVGRIKDIVF